MKESARGIFHWEKEFGSRMLRIALPVALQNLVAASAHIVDGLMVERLGKNEQLIFTTHNTDMLDLNLPKHAFAFMRKKINEGEYNVSVTFASEILKRNTDSVKCAMENDAFRSLPDASLLDELDQGVEA